MSSTASAAQRRFIRDCMRVPLLSDAEEGALATAWRDRRDERALQRLVTAHVRLVIAGAYKFKRYGLMLEDLIQEGNVALMLAAERFDPDRGVRFSTYASWWIRANMQDFVLRNWSIVRGGTTTTQKRLFFGLQRLRIKIAESTDQMLTSTAVEDIAAKLGLPAKQVADMDARMSGGDKSLDAAVSEDGATELHELVPDPSPGPESVAILLKDSKTRSRWLKEALQELPDREQRIIRERRLSDRVVTLEELGREFGISKERTRQLEVRALARLRTALSGMTDRPADLLLES